MEEKHIEAIVVMIMFGGTLFTIVYLLTRNEKYKDDDSDDDIQNPLGE